jgi:hypothetical protein
MKQKETQLEFRQMRTSLIKNLEKEDEERISDSSSGASSKDYDIEELEDDLENEEIY